MLPHLALDGVVHRLHACVGKEENEGREKKAVIAVPIIRWLGPGEADKVGTWQQLGSSSSIAPDT